MLRYCLIAILLQVGANCFAQRNDTLRVFLDNQLRFSNKKKGLYPAMAIKSNNHWFLVSVYPDTGLLVRAYFADRDLSVKDGPFQLYHRNNVKAMEGIYSNNIRQGVWKYWYPNGQMKDSGMIKNNQLADTWYSWYENGNISTKETYVNNKITHLECFDTSGNAQGYFCSIQKPAVPVTASYTNFQNYLLDNIFWPRELDGKNVNGVVRVSYAISREGMLHDIKVLATPHQLLGQEVVRFLQGIPRWQPAVSHNREVEYRGLLEVPFYR
jgi:hypothetical protein